MPSEALRNIRTMRQVKSSLDLANNRKVKTTSSLFRTNGEAEPAPSLSDPRARQILEAEKKRFAAREAAIDKSRQRLLKAREKLAATINRNLVLTVLRHELQQARSNGKNPVSTKLQIEAQPTAKAQAQPQARIEAQPQRKAKTKPAVKTKLAVKAKTQPQAKAKTKPEAQTESRPQAKAKTEAKLQAEAKASDQKSKLHQIEIKY